MGYARRVLKGRKSIMASTEKSINYTMRLFSACAIVLVVVGHIPSTGFNGPFDMFKPYSFQVAAFVFVAGYFYKESHEVHPFQYLKSRIKRLLIPLVAINAAYGCLVLLLKKLVGITWGGSLCPDATSDALYRWPSVSYQHAHVVYRSFVFRRVAQSAYSPSLQAGIFNEFDE